MKIINPSHQILKEKNQMLIIEKAGRTCYKSEANITDESAEKFVRNLTTRKHYAMLEHGTIYMRMTKIMYESLLCALEPGDDKYIILTETEMEKETVHIASGNVRAWYELLLRKNNKYPYWSALLYAQIILTEYMPAVFGELPALNDKITQTTSTIKIITEDELCEILKDHPEDLMKHHRITIQFVCDRGVTHEFVRHRDASFAQESTRYCNYSKGQFGNEITVIKPIFFEESTEDYNDWKESAEHDETKYFKLLANGRTPQEARIVLPTGLKAELIITTSENEWQHICNLRAKGTTGAPHPQMKEVMYPCYEELISYTNGRIS